MIRINLKDRQGTSRRTCRQGLHLDYFERAPSDRRAIIYLESDFWECLEQISERRGVTLDELTTGNGRDIWTYGLPAALRVFVLCYSRGPGLEVNHQREIIANRLAPSKLVANKTLH